MFVFLFGQTVLGLIGSTCSPLMGFVLPGLIYLRAMSMVGIDTSLRHLVCGPPSQRANRDAKRNRAWLHKRFHSSSEDLLSLNGSDSAAQVLSADGCGDGDVHLAPCAAIPSESRDLRFSLEVADDMPPLSLGPQQEDPMLQDQSVVWRDTVTVRRRLGQAYLVLGVGLVLIPTCLTVWFLDEIAS